VIGNAQRRIDEDDPGEEIGPLCGRQSSDEASLARPDQRHVIGIDRI
jgi:hypothetical protein